MIGKILLLAIALILVCCGKSTADTLTADELKLKDAMLRYSEAEIARRKEAIESLKRSTSNPGRAAGAAPSVRQHQEAINRHTKQPLQLPRFYILGGCKVGDIGQFLDAHHSPITCRIFQVIDGRNMIVQWPTRSSTAERLFWVTGVDTTGWADGGTRTLREVFEITGTRQYETAGGGTRTVFEFTLFSIQDTDALIKKIETIESAAKETLSKKDADRERRTWTDASGSFTVEATFGGIMAGKVLLVRQDGSKLHVTREQLSDADNEYLDEITKR